MRRFFFFSRYLYLNLMGIGIGDEAGKDIPFPVNHFYDIAFPMPKNPCAMGRFLTGQYVVALYVGSIKSYHLSDINETVSIGGCILNTLYFLTGDFALVLRIFKDNEEQHSHH